MLRVESGEQELEPVRVVGLGAAELLAQVRRTRAVASAPPSTGIDMSITRMSGWSALAT